MTERNLAAKYHYTVTDTSSRS